MHSFGVFFVVTVNFCWNSCIAGGLWIRDAHGPSVNAYCPGNARQSHHTLIRGYKVFTPRVCVYLVPVTMFVRVIWLRSTGAKEQNFADIYPDSKLRRPHVDPTWILSAPRWAIVGPKCLAIWVGKDNGLLMHHRWWYRGSLTLLSKCYRR